MNRLQKKCVIASTGVHLLLALVLIVGPAFVSPRAPQDDLPILDFVPMKTVDALVSGGGNPKAQPPAPAPEPQPLPPASQPKVVLKLPDPDPPKVAPKEVAPKPEESLEPSLDAKPKKPVLDLTLKPRSKSSLDDAKAKAEDKARTDAQRRLANELGKIAQSIKSNTSGATTVELPGPGGGGVPYANFLQAVKSVYANAWVVPDGVTDDQATAIASVTIARDGRVVKARITDRSGNTLVDQSVQATLDRVRYAAPLPDDAKEDQRTVNINFNVRAKRGLG